MTARRGLRALIAACLAVAVLLVLVDLRQPGPGQALRGAVGAVVGPPQRAVAWLRQQVQVWAGGTTAAQAEIERLTDELQRTREQAAAVARSELQAQSARELAGLAPAGFRPVPGRLVALSPLSDPVRSASISAGSADGIGAGMPVLAAGGLAGIVQTVSPQLATVRLVVDPGTSLAARVASSGEVGILAGTGRGATFRLLDPLGQMTVGDLVVTIGSEPSGLPADLPVGRVSAITGSAADLSREATIAPLVDDSTLDRVTVLVGEVVP